MFECEKSLHFLIWASLRRWIQWSCAPSGSLQYHKRGTQHYPWPLCDGGVRRIGGYIFIEHWQVLSPSRHPSNTPQSLLFVHLPLASSLSFCFSSNISLFLALHFLWLSSHISPLLPFRFAYELMVGRSGEREVKNYPPAISLDRIQGLKYFLAKNVLRTYDDEDENVLKKWVSNLWRRGNWKWGIGEGNGD